MRIDRVYMPVETLGPGERIAVWTYGCSKGCARCANPELWDADAAPDVSIDKLAAILLEMSDRSGITRLTLTGGDPLEQSEELLNLLRKVRSQFKDILVYTGYTIDETTEAIGQSAFEELKGLSDALMDGPYVEALNDGACALRGSINQRLHLFNDGLYEDYAIAMAEPRRVQNVVFDGRSMSIGIHGGRYQS